MQFDSVESELRAFGSGRSGNCRLGVLTLEHTRLTVKMSANQNPPPRSKRQTLDKHETKQEGGRSSILSCLELIPLEILAEVLSYMNSPKDILSVARCSKHFCATLLNPSNVMIWRRARRDCIVPDLPPPLPGWSESAYAAFVFDEGHCYVRHCHFTHNPDYNDMFNSTQICHVVTKRMFWSFVARIRICGQVRVRLFLMDILLIFMQPGCRRKLLGCVMFLINLYLHTNFSGQVTMLLPRVSYITTGQVQNRAFFKRDLGI